jgi:hypothetical protein
VSNTKYPCAAKYWSLKSKVYPVAECGPPWLVTIIGYGPFFAS